MVRRVVLMCEAEREGEVGKGWGRGRGDWRKKWEGGGEVNGGSERGRREKWGEVRRRGEDLPEGRRGDGVWPERKFPVGMGVTGRNESRRLERNRVGSAGQNRDS